VIDFHCHLDLYLDPKAVAEQCRARRLYVLSVTTTPSAWEGTSALATDTPRIKTALGLHPQIAHERLGELPLFDRLIGETRYVGEIGLDGSPELRSHWDAQVTAFSHTLKTCHRAGGKIMSIHSRRAAKAVLDALEEVPGAGVPVLHWFSGTARELARAVSMGCWFSVGPAMLSSEKGRMLAAKMPRDRLLTESDGPFARVSDVTLMPWDAPNAASGLATCWSLPEEEVARTITANFRSLVGRDVSAKAGLT
jgi:TatD DNase family protein